MDYKDIEDLLDKYWACETSLEEEDRLKVFFSKEDVPENLLPYVPMFRYYQQIRSRKTSSDFDENILDRIKRNDVVNVKQRYISRMYKVAAAVLLVLSFVLIHERYISVKKEAISFAQDTFEDPKAALDEAKRVSDQIGRQQELDKAEREEELERITNLREMRTT